MISQDVKRVFFHELGHFVAREINHLYYSGQGTKSIEIYPYPYNNELFLGDTKVNQSVDGSEKKAPTVEKLPEYLASSTYGCFFQSIYQNSSLKQCFAQNGEDDMQKWFSAMLANGLDWCNSDIANYDSEYFDLLKEKGELDELMKLVPENYLIDNGNNSFDVNIVKLKEDILPFIKNHYKVYRKLIEKYKEILSQSE